MQDQWIIAGVAGAYLVACLVIGLRAGKGSSASATGYVAGDRGMGTLVMYFITGASIFSAFAFLGAPGKAYSQGVSVLWILAYGTLGFIPFYWLGPRAARLGRKYGFVTQAEMVAHRFDSRGLALLMALVSVLAFLPYLALQMKGAGIVLEVVTGGVVSTELGALLVYGVVFLYVAKSGVLGVGWTNTFQGIFMLVLAWVLGITVPTMLYGGIAPMFERLAAEKPEYLTPPGLTGSGTPWNWSEYGSTVLVLAIGFSFWPHLFMKAFTAKSSRVLQRTVVLYPTFQLFLVPLLLIGFAGILYSNPPSQPDQILPHLLLHLELHPLIVGLFCAGALAASMSSGDAILHASASILVRDGWISGCGKELDPEAERRAVRMLLVPILAGAYWMAVGGGQSLVDRLVLAYGPVGQLAPVVVAALCWRGATRSGALAGLLGGTVVTVFFSLRPDFRPFAIHAGLYGIVLNVGLLVLVSKLTKPADGPSEETLEFIRAGSESGA
ncbi:MAG: SSS family solute:Na+ symporter [Candidatus Paceibacteria bacterium]|jgi:SSS family solute:Na+ symporter